MEISKNSIICVVGVGKVGMSIIQAFAQQGFEIRGTDVNGDNLTSGLQKVDASLSTLILKGKISEDEKDRIIKRIKLGTDMEAGISDADIVIEAVFEDMDLKKDLFKKMDELVKSSSALLLSNTSSLCISEIASATKRPDKVAGMHFFNPVPVMKLVEIIKGVETSDQTIEKVKDLTELLNKIPVVSADSPGFIVSRMLNAMIVEAARIVEQGVATQEDVNLAAKYGLGHPMGPFELFDMLEALPLLTHVLEYMQQDLGSHFRAPMWMKNRVKAGKKTFSKF